MKWLRYSLWTIVAMAAVAGVCIAWKRHEERNRREVEQWLTSIVIPKFELRDQTLDEAVVMFNQVIEATPNHAHDLKIVIAPEKETQKLFRRALKMKDLVESPSAGSRGPEIAPDQTAGREARFNKRETNTSLRELILHFKYRDALSYRIRGRQVILYVHHMPGTVFPLRTRIFQLSQLGGEILLEATPDRDRHGDVINAGPVLAYNGYTLRRWLCEVRYSHRQSGSSHDGGDARSRGKALWAHAHSQSNFQISIVAEIQCLWALVRIAAWTGDVYCPDSGPSAKLDGRDARNSGSRFASIATHGAKKVI